VRAEAKRLEIGLGSLPPYCPHPSPIGHMWKNVKSVMSTRTEGNLNAIRNVMNKTFYQLPKNLDLRHQA